jgi:hypothetical protein
LRPGGGAQRHLADGRAISEGSEQANLSIHVLSTCFAVPIKARPP